MHAAAYAFVIACWAVWAWPYLRAHRGPRERTIVTRAAHTVAGLVLQCAGYAAAFSQFGPAGPVRLALAVLLAAAAVPFSWTSLRHLGKQFRVQAGLYEGHELVRTGPYALVRHPIYASMLLLFASALCLGTRWPWWLIATVIFVAGTEIRVRAEDGLLHAAFGEAFEQYRARVPAYLPFVR